MNPTFINIGTKTGARIAHLAEADPMKILMNATTKINKITSGIPCNPIAVNKSAPSTTNLISPLMSYFALIVTFAAKYAKKSGIGTLVSTMVPYSIALLIGWTILLVVWFVLRLPLGPGIEIFLPGF